MLKTERLAIFITDLSGGGAERVIANLACGLVGLGYPVDFVLVHKRGAFLDLLPAEVNVVDLHGRSPIQSVAKLVKYLRASRPAALLSALNQPNVAAVLAKRLAGVDTRVVISIHNNLAEEAAWTPNLKRRLMPAFARAFFPKADAIVAVSEHSATENATFLGLAPDRIRVVANPVVTPSLFENAAKPCDHPWLAPGEPPVILGIGRLTRQKNFGMLIEAFAKIAPKTDARLLILGEGDDRNALEAQLERLDLRSRVELPGFVPNPYAYLARARIFALSSLWEGLPTVLIESLAAGTPVVSTQCPSGPKEILENGKYGRLCPVDDADVFAEQLLAELSTEKKAPPREAYARYELQPVAEDYIKVLLPLAS
jgi:glycosyltransferase involved in cell wall biosynthesis